MKHLLRSFDQGCKLLFCLFFWYVVRGLDGSVLPDVCAAKITSWPGFLSISMLSLNGQEFQSFT